MSTYTSWQLCMYVLIYIYIYIYLYTHVFDYKRNRRDPVAGDARVVERRSAGRLGFEAHVYVYIYIYIYYIYIYIYMYMFTHIRLISNMCFPINTLSVNGCL